MVNVLNCGLRVSKFELQSHTFGKGIEPPYPSGYGLNNITDVPVVKIEMKIDTHLSTNVSAYDLCARFIFLTGKNIAALSELISQMVSYLHAGSHIKPQSEDAHANEGWQKRT